MKLIFKWTPNLSIWKYNLFVFTCGSVVLLPLLPVVQINKQADTTILNNYNKQVWLVKQEGNGCVLFAVLFIEIEKQIGLNEQPVLCN